MWRILKADLAYNKIIIFMAYGIIFFLKFGELYQQIFSSIIMAFIAIGIMGSKSDNERRERLQTLLPIPAKTISLARLLFVIIFQAGIFFLWITTSLIGPTGSAVLTINTMLSANALLLILINMLILYTDLGYYQKTIYKFMFWIAIFVTGPVIIWLIYNGHGMLFLHKNASLSGIVGETIVYNLICLIFFVVNYKVFLGRISYLK